MEVDGVLYEFDRLGDTEYYRVNEGEWMDRDTARKQNATPSSLPTKNK